MENKPWKAEFNVTFDLVKHLIETQFPTLKPTEICLIGQGWDNVVYRVNKNYIFRFPRRKLGADLIHVETKVLPHLVNRLLIAIPTPLFVGKPTKEYPWSFLGYDFVHGEPASSARLTRDERINIAESLAHFLKSLHMINEEPAQAMGAKYNHTKLNIKRNWEITTNNLNKIKKLKLFNQCNKLLKLLDNLKSIKTTGEKVLLHGDLYFRHLLVSPARKLCGVIDWGDVCIGNPAIDLQVVFSFLPKDGHRNFFNIYGSITVQMQELALLRALYLTSYIVVYSHDINDQDVMDEALLELQILSELY